MRKRRKRRSWSDDEKREICQQTAVPAVSVAQVARRYAMNANLIPDRLKDPRFVPEPEAPEQETTLLSIEIEADAVREGPKATKHDALWLSYKFTYGHYLGA